MVALVGATIRIYSNDRKLQGCPIRRAQSTDVPASSSPI